MLYNIIADFCINLACDDDFLTAENINATTIYFSDKNIATLINKITKMIGDKIMFGLGKNNKGEFKEVLKQCTTLKDEIVELLKSNHGLSGADMAKFNQTLEEYEKTKEEMLSIKNNKELRPREKLTAATEKKDAINKIKADLENAKKLLEGK